MKQINDEWLVKDLANNIGLLLSRFIDEKLLITRFPDQDTRHSVMNVISSVVDIFLLRTQKYLPLEYSKESWRCLRLLREVFELSEPTVTNIEDLIQCYKNSETEYMSI
jgi:hypothetical protein